MRAALLIVLAATTACVSAEQQETNRLMTECWGARPSAENADEFDITFDAIVLGEPHHGTDIFGGTSRCPGEFLLVRSNNPEISQRLNDFIREDFYQRLERPTPEGEAQARGMRMPPRGLRISARIAPGIRGQTGVNPGALPVYVRHLRQMNALSDAEARSLDRLILP